MKGTAFELKTAYVGHVQQSTHLFWIISRNNTPAMYA
jgi:hypothetical protein